MKCDLSDMRHVLLMFAARASIEISTQHIRCLKIYYKDQKCAQISKSLSVLTRRTVSAWLHQTLSALPHVAHDERSIERKYYFKRLQNKLKEN